MNRTDRLVAMVMFLQGRRLVRAEDLAAHFEISVRTVYRDLAALSESGVPITGEAGVGYSLLRSYHLPPVMLTAEEASALFVGAEMAKHFTDRSLQEPLDSALLKLRAVLPRDRQDYVEQLAKKTLIVGPHDPSGTAVRRDWLLPLQQAAARRKVVRMLYRARARDQDTLREVEPLGIVFQGAVWYLVAWCRLRASLRHFRLDRMQRVELTNETFEPRPEFSLAHHLESVAAQGEMIPVRLWSSKRVLERVRRESYAVVIEEARLSDGVEVSMATYSLDWLAAWILSFGGEVQAIEPETLVEKVRGVAERTLRQHCEAERATPQLA